MIKLNCDYLNGAVAVPTDIIDKHLKLAPVASFKVLLFILRNPEGTESAEQIAMCTGLPEGEVSDCLMYWQSYGVIRLDNVKNPEMVKKATANAKSPCEITEPEAPKPTPSPVKVKSLPVKKPTPREIAKRLQEEPELTIIYNEAQMILGTFGYDTQAVILMIYDHYGFPPEVIITLLQHQKCEGKTSTAAIKSRAEEWAKRGIDSLDLVEKELLALEKINAFYNEIKVAAGLDSASPTPRAAKFLRDWAVNWDCSADLVRYALEECNKTLTDTNKLLKKWVNQGIKSPDQVQEKAKKLLPKEVKKSYTTENVGRNSVLDWAKKYAEGEDNN